MFEIEKSGIDKVWGIVEEVGDYRGVEDICI